MVVTGDVTQIDLPREQDSGLVVVSDILETVEGIEFVRFGEEDVVRHKLVQRIVAAYNDHARAPGAGAGNTKTRVTSAALDIEVIGLEALEDDGPTAVEVRELCVLALSSAGSPTGTWRSSSSTRSGSGS